MAESDAVSSLEHLGLTGYEARVFIALQKLGSGTARDVHRVAEVPRSQVYSAAENLEERGLVEVQQSNPMRYRPVSIETARSILRERFEREQERAFDYVEGVREEHSDDGEEQEDIWTVRGQEHVEDRIVELIREAEESVIFGTPDPDLMTETIETALRDREKAGLYVGVVSVDEGVFFSEHGEEDAFPVNPNDSTDARVAAKRRRRDSSEDRIVGKPVPDVSGINRETAFWSVETNFASALIELMNSSFDSFDRKV
ncbi:TrmB family transcriptional regulator [Halostella pelagica]|uniref:TrmB family transcriptional regulator n=1 Tax=Halostella pelagica TaxID=2583824 RepID=UPI00108029E6|nr:helix-turn-helix domain-containing protein [Halostella pelagica]